MSLSEAHASGRGCRRVEAQAGGGGQRWAEAGITVQVIVVMIVVVIVAGKGSGGSKILIRGGNYRIVMAYRVQTH
jgi:hypothetical protein